MLYNLPCQRKTAMFILYLFLIRDSILNKQEVFTMAISSDLIRGHTDTIILAHLMRQDDYGYSINKNIQEKTQNAFELKEATLYSAFRRLEKEGHIESYWGGENSGARRRYYSITPAGREAYSNLCNDWQQAKTMIDQLISIS